MRFLMTVRSAEDQGAPPQGLLDAMDTFVKDSLADGSLIETGGLAGSAQGARIRLSGGKLKAIDGPFTEAKEVIGGYALIEAASRAEALAAARRFMQLHADTWPEWEGEVEIRELVFFAPEP
jgi:hypothetical protein